MTDDTSLKPKIADKKGKKDKKGGNRKSKASELDNEETKALLILYPNLEITGQ